MSGSFVTLGAGFQGTQMGYGFAKSGSSFATAVPGMIAVENMMTDNLGLFGALQVVPRSSKISGRDLSLVTLDLPLGATWRSDGQSQFLSARAAVYLGYPLGKLEEVGVQSYATKPFVGLLLEFGSYWRLFDPIYIGGTLTAKAAVTSVVKTAGNAPSYPLDVGTVVWVGKMF